VEPELPFLCAAGVDDGGGGGGNGGSEPVPGVLGGVGVPSEPDSLSPELLPSPLPFPDDAADICSPPSLAVAVAVAPSPDVEIETLGSSLELDDDDEDEKDESAFACRLRARRTNKNVTNKDRCLRLHRWQLTCNASHVDA
jgi:hypothetical protein